MLICFDTRQSSVFLAPKQIWVWFMDMEMVFEEGSKALPTSKEIQSSSSRVGAQGTERVSEDPCERLGKRWQRSFPGTPVVKSLPSQWGVHRFEPWSRKIPHDAGQLSPCSAKWEAQAPREEPPLTTTRDSPCAATKTQYSQKWINFKKDKQEKCKQRRKWVWLLSGLRHRVNEDRWEGTLD